MPLKKLARIEDSEESLRRLAEDAANAAERRQAAIEQRPARKFVSRTTKEKCQLMTQKGWVSYLLADAIAEYRPSYPYERPTSESETLFPMETIPVRANRYTRENRTFDRTRTCQAWQTSQEVPTFNASRAHSAVLRYEDPNQGYECEVLVDQKDGLLCAEYKGKALVGFLEDFPPNLLSYLPEEISQLCDIEAEEAFGREGAILVQNHVRRERDRNIVIKKRQQVLDATGCLACSVCGFDFRLFYGEIGSEFCEVHHLVPLANAVGEIETRLEDLAVVCSNCHRMIHRNRPFLTLEELKSGIIGRGNRLRPSI